MAKRARVGGSEEERRRTPPGSLTLAYAAMVPVAAGALVAVRAPAPVAGAVSGVTIRWSGAVLCFLSGVRRGLSFRQKGGATASEIGAMLFLFTVGAASLLMPRRRAALALLLLGYGAEAAIDPAAAREGEAPRYFARLRPVQLLVPIASLTLLLARERPD